MTSKKISIVLGSGGARGITQIGVIKYLLDHNYEIDEVVGCSIGSLVGAAFADGKINELGEWMSLLTRTEVFRLMDFSNPRFGLLKGNKVLNSLQEVFKDREIDSFPIKYAAVATDLVSECELVFRKGSVYNAIRASIAIPAVFKGVVMNEMFLVDGGVLNPLPLNHVVHRNNTVIAVNLDGPPVVNGTVDYNKLSSIGILQESYRIMRSRLSKLNIERYKPDYLIDIPHNISGVWDFDRSKFLIEKGYEFAKEVMEKGNVLSAKQG